MSPRSQQGDHEGPAGHLGGPVQPVGVEIEGPAVGPEIPEGESVVPGHLTRRVDAEVPDYVEQPGGLAVEVEDYPGLEGFANLLVQGPECLVDLVVIRGMGSLTGCRSQGFGR